MRRCLPLGLLSSLLVLVALTHSAVADESYYLVTPVQQLEFAGQAERAVTNTHKWWSLYDRPYVVVPTGTEAFVTNSTRLRQLMRQVTDRDLHLPDDTWLLAVRSPTAQIEGQLFVPVQLRDRLRPGEGSYAFKLSALKDDDEQRERFFLAKRACYGEYMQQDMPGGAWFRHQARQAEAELDFKLPNAEFAQRRFFGTRAQPLQSTFALVSGGRAVAENLQLDRELVERPGADAAADLEATVPVDSIEGITIREFEWRSLVEGVSADPDPLAASIPADQHAVFFPSFAALTAFADHAAEFGTPVLQAGEPRAEDARTRERYERQLGLSLNQAARLFGPQLIRSVAITGGDLYLRTGSDVAVLFEAADPAALHTLLEAQIALASGAAGARAVDGEQSGTSYRGYVTPNRHISSYVARIGDVLVVTNSLAQLDRITACQRGDGASLASLPEYTFFRHRYPRGDRETAFAVLSDATIRRWCSPKWRIATSRRTRAAAVLAELEAEYLGALVAGTVQSRQVQSPFSISEAKTFLVNTDGLRSEQYGDLSFQTPILEMPLTHVTPAEAEMYRRWRDGYQRNWSNFFDPIAIRFELNEQMLAADLTVMPLINNSQYRWMETLSRGAKLSEAKHDAHPEALLMWHVAINPANPDFRSRATWAAAVANVLGVDPLSWMGSSLSVYVDDDPLWAELAALRQANPDRQIEQMELAQYLPRLPLALHVDVSSGLKLTAFLTTLRAFIEQTAPGMTVWETRQHEGTPYVRIGPSDAGREEFPGGVPEQLGLYYAAGRKGLTVTFSESLIQRALERRRGTTGQAAATTNAADQEPSAADTAELLGESMTLEVDKRVAEFLTTFFDDAYQQRLQRLAWNNLPILNEWKRRFPEHDPVQLHETYWGLRLRCPGGGEYRWNEQLQTMESTVLGCPAAPRTGASLPPALAQLHRARFGLTFEPNGLRARAQLIHAQPSDEAAAKR